MTTRLTAEQAREIPKHGKTSQSALRSRLWEKHKKDVLLSAINGGTTYLVIGQDAHLIPKLNSLDLEATEVFRKVESEKKHSELEDQIGDILLQQESCLRALKEIISANTHFVSAWEELMPFLNWTEDVSFWEIEEDLDYFDFEDVLSELPESVSSNIRKLLALESDLFESKEVMEELENEIEDSPLPKGADYGVTISWSSDFLTVAETVTNRISLPLLCWLSSESGQSSINAIENRIKASIAKKKKSCQLDIQVGGEQSEQSVGGFFPSVEVFQLIFETLGYLVQDKQAQIHSVERPSVASLVLSWA